MRRKVRVYVAWLVALLATMQVAMAPRAARADELGSGSSATPVIGVTYVPAYGERGDIQGRVFCEDGSDLDPSGYRVAMFIQIYDGGKWWPKSTYEQPYCYCQEGGYYNGKFITGGDDIHAQIIHLYLVTSGYTSGNPVDAQAEALDYVRIDRSQDGSVSISPNRQAPDPGDKAPAMDANMPVSQNRIAVDVDFHIDGSRPGSPLSEGLIRRQLDALSSFADCVRFYSAGGEESKAYGIAHEMGFSVVGTAYLCGDEASDRAEMDALIEHCNSGLVDVACVGNETLLDTGYGPKLTASELIADIRYVRERLVDESIPVTTSDSVDVLMDNPAIRNACNTIMPNCYPFWGGVPIDDAAASFEASIAALQAVAGDKQVIVSEVGHPTGGNAYGDAVPGEEQAARYFEEIRAWSLRTGTQTFFFMGCDCPWKEVVAYGGEGSVGSHWGFMTSNLELKEAYARTSFFEGLGIGAGCVHHKVVDAAKDATCTEAGLTAGSHCSVCGAVFEAQEEVPAEGHAWGSWACTREATEQAEGEETRTCANDASHTQTRAIPKLESSKPQVIRASNKTVAMGSKVSLGAKVTVGGGTLTYKSSDKKVLTVSAKGVVTPVGVGKATVTITAAATTGYQRTTKKVTVTVKKGAQPMAVKARSASVKLATVAKKVRVLAVSKVFAFTTAPRGEVTYKRKSGSSVLSVDSKTGAVTVRKGTKRGSYKIKVVISAAGDANWKAGSKTVTITVRVK